MKCKCCGIYPYKLYSLTGLHKIDYLCNECCCFLSKQLQSLDNMIRFMFLSKLNYE